MKPLRNILWISFWTVAGIFLILNLVLGSKPVQNLIIQEIRIALADTGFTLEIESIEFSTFRPIIFLNRVILTPNRKKVHSVEQPLKIDKIKVQFDPLRLITKTISFSDISIFHPTFKISNGTAFSRSVDKLIRANKPIATGASSYQISFDKIRVIDANFEVQFPDKKLGVISRSTSIELIDILRVRKRVQLQSTDLTLINDGSDYVLSDLGFDLDWNLKVFTFRDISLKGRDLRLGGQVVFEEQSKALHLLKLEYDLDVKFDSYLKLLRQFTKIQLTGEVSSSGRWEQHSSREEADLKLSYRNLSVAGYPLENGAIKLAIRDKWVTLNKLNLHYAGGQIENIGPIKVSVSDTGASVVQGELKWQGLRLEKILENVHSYDNPVKLGLSGKGKIKGKLYPDLNLQLESETTGDGLYVFNPEARVKQDERVLTVSSAVIESTLVFAQKQMTFSGSVNLLGGRAKTSGHIHYGKDAKIQVQAEALSLTTLKDISGLTVSGVSDATADIVVAEDFVQVHGSMQTRDLQVADINLGAATSVVSYRDGLLSFDSLRVSTDAEPLLGSGFVDFNSEKTFYEFTGNSKRLSIGNVFNFVSGFKLPFRQPKQGETQAAVEVRGGGKFEKFDIRVKGVIKNVEWYDETWFQIYFDLGFVPGITSIKKLNLIKKSGALELSGYLTENKKQLRVVSNQLKLEELEQFRSVPLKGVLQGQGVWLQNGDNTETSGDFEVTQLRFRGRKMADVMVKVTREKQTVSIEISDQQKLLQGALYLKLGTGTWSTQFRVKGYDFWPVLSGVLQQDFPQVSSLIVQGEGSFSGVGSQWEKVFGTSNLKSLSLGLKDQDLSNREPVSLTVKEGRFQVSTFQLTSQAAFMSGFIDYSFSGHVDSKINANLDLEYLQPFLPVLDGGLGRVDLNVDVSGASSHPSIIGHARLENGVLKIRGLKDEIKEVNAQLSLDSEKMYFDEGRGKIGNGNVVLKGGILWNGFKNPAMDLRMEGQSINLTLGKTLQVRLSGDFKLQGASRPYLLSGNCLLHEALLTSFQSETKPTGGSPNLKFDIRCEGQRMLQVSTEVMNAEFKANVNVVGDDERIGLLGEAEGLKGVILFKDKKFVLKNTSVKFESPQEIAPRFNVLAQTTIDESQANLGEIRPANSYEVTLQMRGTPKQYKLQLSSIPNLNESEIISLLVLGVASKTQGRDEGNYLALGTSLVGQFPIQSKLENQLGVDIKIGAQSMNSSSQSTSSTNKSSTSGTSSSQATETTVPNVRIQKDITNRTKLSYASSIEATPFKEIKVEHLLNENISINGMAVERSRTGIDSQTTRSYGVDLRYRFQFE